MRHDNFVKQENIGLDNPFALSRNKQRLLKPGKIIYRDAEKRRNTNQITQSRLALVGFPQTYDGFAHPYRIGKRDLSDAFFLAQFLQSFPETCVHIYIFPQKWENNLTSHYNGNIINSEGLKMFCKYCGTKLKDDNADCPKCGKNNRTEFNDDASDFKFALLGFLVPIAGLVLYLVWKKDFPERSSSCIKGTAAGTLMYVFLPVILILSLVFKAAY